MSALKVMLLIGKGKKFVTLALFVSESLLCTILISLERLYLDCLKNQGFFVGVREGNGAGSVRTVRNQ